MDDEQWQKKMFSFDIGGKNVGHPKKCWLDNIKSDMAVLNLSENLIADRSTWRAAVKTGRRSTPAAGNRGR